MSVKPLLLGALTVAAALSTGCSGSVVSAPRVPVPVLLGPVDRVGGHRGEGPVVAPFSVEIEDFVSASRNTQRVGSQLVTTTTRSFSHEGTGKFSFLVLSSTNAQHDKDVHIRRLDTGAWFWVTPDLASMMLKQWHDVDATVTAEQPR